jgi:hypothetical protein
MDMLLAQKTFIILAKFYCPPTRAGFSNMVIFGGTKEDPFTMTGRRRDYVCPKDSFGSAIGTLVNNSDKIYMQILDF